MNVLSHLTGVLARSRSTDHVVGDLVAGVDIGCLAALTICQHCQVNLDFKKICARF